MTNRRKGYRISSVKIKRLRNVLDPPSSTGRVHSEKISLKFSVILLRSLVEIEGPFPREVMLSRLATKILAG
jgi:hypothetical protein